MTGPVNGLSRCSCGCKYWEHDACIDCGFKWQGPCEQKCGNPAECYAGGPYANDWAGRYCYACAASLKFHVFDHYRKGA